MKKIGKLLFVIFAIILLSACQPRKPEIPVAAAVQQNKLDVVNAYLLGGGDPNIKSRFGDPLIFLATGRQGGVGVTKILINAGADVNVKGRNGIYALTSAASWCNLEEMRLLINAGANVNQRGKNNKTALESVCENPENRRKQAIDILIRAGAE